MLLDILKSHPVNKNCTINNNYKTDFPEIVAGNGDASVARGQRYNRERLTRAVFRIRIQLQRPLPLCAESRAIRMLPSRPPHVFRKQFSRGKERYFPGEIAFV